VIRGKKKRNGILKYINYVKEKVVFEMKKCLWSSKSVLMFLRYTAPYSVPAKFSTVLL